MSKFWRLAREEVQAFNLRLSLARAVLKPLPPFVGTRLRSECLRRMGFSIGPGTMLWGTPKIMGNGDVHRRLTIGSGCWINVDCFLEAGAEIHIGHDVSLGPEVMILTTTHDMDRGTPERRAAGVVSRPVRIEDGAWLGARCTILPGVTVGAGAVVAPGAVVNRDVPPNTFVGGVPAKVIRELSR